MTTDERRKRRQAEHSRRVARELTQARQEYKAARGCCICGLREPAYVLDFHHIDPTTKSLKTFDRYRTLTSLMAEIAKCVVICANHHRMLEAGDIVLPKEAANA
jgi:hypothetical protein